MTTPALKPPHLSGKTVLKRGLTTCYITMIIKAKPSAHGTESPPLRTRARRTTARAVVVLTHTLSFFVWVGLITAATAIYFTLDLPAVDEAALARRPNIRILDARGSEVASFGDIYGRAISLTALPAHVPAAVIAVEDRHFYQHMGIDLRGLLRALVANIQAGRVVQGGSTISQQVAKNLFLSPERTLGRKVKEALLALKLERTFSKDQILALYMNRVYFGGGIYGFEAASERFFAHPAKDLSVFEATLLAGLLKAPSHYSPVREPERAKARARIVLATMVETGALTAPQAAAALRTAGPTLKAAARPAASARYFADWVMGQVDSYVGALDRDLIVETTLDSQLQAAAEKTLSRYLTKSGAKLRVEQGAVVVLGANGAVRAMVGGRDYAQSQFNRATQALRQPGSAYKPFVYLTAVENGYGPQDMVVDAPLKIGKWKPQNFTGTYQGDVTLETALVNSLNTATVRVAQQVGTDAIIATASRMGIAEPAHAELALALGSEEVTLLELTGAYVPFANGGEAVLPYTIVAVRDRGGAVLYQREGGGLGQVVARDILGIMNRMLTQVIARGTGTAAAFGFPAAGKTGTSSDFRDAWFLGFTSDYVTGVWVGNDSGQGMRGVTGGGLPALVWRDVMIAAHEGHQPRELPGVENDRDNLSRPVIEIFSPR